jgi:hypothetical protein
MFSRIASMNAFAWTALGDLLRREPADELVLRAAEQTSVRDREPGDVREVGRDLSVEVIERGPVRVVLDHRQDAERLAANAHRHRDEAAHAELLDRLVGLRRDALA